MATVALATVGGIVGSLIPGLGTIAGIAVGTAIGTAVGGAVGSYIDSQYLMPAIFGRGGGGGITGPRLDDFQVQTASEGSPIKFVLGPQNRIAGTLIYLSKRIEVPVTHGSSGGKGGAGGSGASSTSWDYFHHINIGVCEGPINAIRKVWADSKLIYQDEGVGHDTSAWEAHSGSNTFEATGVDFEALGFVVDRYITVIGFADAANNGTFKIDGITVGALTVSQLGTYVGGVLPHRLPWAGLTDETAPGVVEVRMKPVLDTRYTSLTVYTGEPTQSVDPLLESLEPNTPAYRNTAHVVIEKFKINDWGRIPDFSFLVEQRRRMSVAQAITALCDRAGVQVEVDAFEVRGLLTGYSISENTTTVQALEPLILAYNLNVTESEGKLIFFTRSKEHVVIVNPGDLAAVASDEDENSVPHNVQLRDTFQQDLPSEVVINYIEPANNYQTGSQKDRRVNITVRNVAEINMPLVLTASQARAIASRLLWSPYTERYQAAISLPGSYVEIQEGDLIPVTADGTDYIMRVDQADQGSNYQFKVTGAVVEPQTYRAEGSVDLPTTTVPLPPYIPPELRVHYLDLPPLRDEDTVQGGFYFSVCAMDPAREWRGAIAFTSPDDINYVLSFSAPYEAIIGETYGTVVDDGPVGYWDLTSELFVEVKEGTLESATELEVLNGANTALVGDEIMAYQFATLVDVRQYRLNKLLRGLRDTRSATGTHASAERFVKLEPGKVGWKSLSSGLVNVNRFYKTVGAGGTVDSVDPEVFATTGRTLRQFAPCHCVGVRDSSDNLTINWVRRSRAVSRLFSWYCPLLHNEERYEIDVLNGSTVVRTLIVVVATGSPTVDYSAVDQTTDFGSPQSSLDIRLYQIGPSGRGNVLEITV